MSLINYPPTILTQLDDLNVLQITDLHLFRQDTKNISGYSYNTISSFTLVLQQALSDKRCDLILVTGDLIDEMDYSLYDDVFTILQQTNIPFACISGNHDVTDEVGDNVPFYEKDLVPYPEDPRLLNRHLIESQHWQIILLDSSDAGEVSGWIDQQDLDWLANHLSNNTKPAIICMHHHLLPIGSAWIDEYMVLNSQQLWQTIAPFKQVKSIVHGHIHQFFDQTFNDVRVLGSASTCYQFTPYSHDFAIDNVPAGYRWLTLHNNGILTTEEKRLGNNTLML